MQDTASDHQVEDWKLEKIEYVLREARKDVMAHPERKDDWQVYEFYKQQVAEMYVPGGHYESFIKRLCDILEI